MTSGCPALLRLQTFLLNRAHWIASDPPILRSSDPPIRLNVRSVVKSVLLDGVSNSREQSLLGYRFGQVVECAAIHRLDQDGYVCCAGQHHDWQLGRKPPNAVEGVQAGHIR
jgi:hypothetical protein